MIFFAVFDYKISGKILAFGFIERSLYNIMQTVPECLGDENAGLFIIFAYRCFDSKI